MNTKRTYDTYKKFFEEVSHHNKQKNYHHSYILLYSFIEDRVDRIYRDQYRHKNNHLPSESEMLDSLYRKLVDIDRHGLIINRSYLTVMKEISERRNELVHHALFNIHTVTKKDVDILNKFGRKLNEMREKQKKRLPKVSSRKKLQLLLQNYLR